MPEIQGFYTAATSPLWPEISPAQRAGESTPKTLRPEGTLELSKSGYTLVELLCTIGIIGILAALYLGVIARAFIYIMKFVNHFEGH